MSVGIAASDALSRLFANTSVSPLITVFLACLHSTSHLFRHDLKDYMAVTGSNITVTIDLIGGTTFKIIGMMLCKD